MIEQAPKIGAGGGTVTGNTFKGLTMICYATARVGKIDDVSRKPWAQ